MFEDFRLRVFDRVAGLGSFTAAARSLGITQPAVSQHIAELEKEAGGRLFDRSRGHVELTPRGRQFAELAARVLDSYHALNQAFHVPDSILLKDVELDGRRTCILIRDGCFADLDAPALTPADRTVDAAGLAILPAFYNTHIHAATVLRRGRTGGSPEGELPPEEVRRGNELAIAEMAACGTAFFADMFFDPEEGIAAAESSPLRAAIGVMLSDRHPKLQADALEDYIKNWQDPSGGRIQLTIAPASVLALSPARLKRVADFARRHGLLIQLHLAQTRNEVDECVRKHGLSPVRLLDKLGILGPDVLAAHCIHVDAAEWKILARRGVTVAHCPRANLRLGRGRFPYELALDAGVRISLGTDEVPAGGNLDLREEMQCAALHSGAPAEEVFRWATRSGAEFFGLDAGRIAVGALADAVLLDLSHPKLRCGGPLVGRWVFSGDSGCIRNTLCAGRMVR